MNDTPMADHPARALTPEPNRDDEPHRSRRYALRLIGGAGLGLVAAACGATKAASGGSTSTTGSPSTTAGATGSPSTTAGATPSTTAAAGAASCSKIPEETAGPYPGDGSNGVNVLTQDGIVRRDIRSSFGSSSTVAAGVPLTIELRVVDTTNGCQPLAGAAVYLWHCDQDGQYSLYTQGITNENYLRGVQGDGSDGTVRFTSIFPGCYSGRWPHIHFEVYPSVASARSSSGKLATSQLALPKDVCDAVYATSGYETSARNLGQTSLSTDNVFRDGAGLETPTVTGSPTDGYVATLVVPV
jgi:protocatechuate 3,4-dioxygenase beta subunit